MPVTNVEAPPTEQEKPVEKANAKDAKNTKSTKE